MLSETLAGSLFQGHKKSSVSVVMLPNSYKDGLVSTILSQY